MWTQHMLAIKFFWNGVWVGFAPLKWIWAKCDIDRDESSILNVCCSVIDRYDLWRHSEQHTNVNGQSRAQWKSSIFRDDCRRYAASSSIDVKLEVGGYWLFHCSLSIHCNISLLLRDYKKRSSVHSPSFHSRCLFRIRVFQLLKNSYE